MQTFVGDGFIVAVICECVGCAVGVVGSVFSKYVVVYSGYALMGVGLLIYLVACLSTML